MAGRRDEEVLRLQVPVDDPLVVRGRKASGNLQRVFERLVRGNRPGFQLLAERPSFEKLHDGIGNIGLASEIEDREDVRVRQRGYDLGLVLEAGERLHVAGERVGKDLDGHVAVERRVPGAPDLAHPARAERRDDLVRAEPGSRGEAHGGGRSVLHGLLIGAVSKRLTLTQPSFPQPSRMRR